MSKWLLVFSLILCVSAQADAMSFERECRKIYKTKKNKVAQKVCFCIESNLRSRLTDSQMRELQKTYSNRSARIAASQNETLKSVYELDALAHTQCNQNSSWKIPVEDLGQPDAL